MKIEQDMFGSPDTHAGIESLKQNQNDESWERNWSDIIEVGIATD